MPEMEAVPARLLRVGDQVAANEFAIGEEDDLLTVSWLKMDGAVVDVDLVGAGELTYHRAAYLEHLVSRAKREAPTVDPEAAYEAARAALKAVEREQQEYARQAMRDGEGNPSTVASHMQKADWAFQVAQMLLPRHFEAER